MTDNYQINNNEYSAPNSPAEREMVSIVLPREGTNTPKDAYSRNQSLTLDIPKFLFCMTLSQGFKVIGILEVVAFILQLINIRYSVRIGVAMILIFNVPLIFSWTASQFFKSKNESAEAYKWNTVFISVYSMRFLFSIVGGLIAVIIAYHSDSSMDFICDRYYDIDYDTNTYTEK